MNHFTSESSIGGVVVFHSSEPKKARIGWLFVYFLFFILLGYYVFFIYTRYKLEPEFSYKFSEFPLQEIPFPAVTVCSPLFARNQSVNLQEFLKNPTQNLTVEQQNLLAANVQACAPELGPKIDKFCPLADTRKTIDVLKSKFLNVDDSFLKMSFHGACSFNWQLTSCSRLFNYVLTDFGYCFTFNLEGFSTLFNTKIISDDFKSYSRDGKTVRNYNWKNPNYNLTIIEANQSIDWNLEKGFLTNSSETLPVRIFYKKGLTFRTLINNSDETNRCPKMGRSFSMFFHMPNEILTPFHQPKFVQFSSRIALKAKLLKVDESLRPFPPQKRNCYFEGEQNLKFFKSYTKAHCQFECLTNFTLAQCGCVKFSMPRENSTRICGLNETSCYIQVAKNWNLTCDCLHPCTYIEYGIVQESNLKKYLLSMQIVILSDTIFGEITYVFGVYGIYQGFADFGGMLGTLFGASLISLIEIYYFLTLNFMTSKFNIQEKTDEIQASKFASSSTIHGIQFIFDMSRHKFVRIFWIVAFIFAFSCCIYNSREGYWKLNVVPEVESTTNTKLIEEIPFPAVTIFSPIFAKKNLTINYFEFNSKFNKNNSIIKDLSSDQFNYLIANLYWSSPNINHVYIRERKIHAKIATEDPENHRSGDDLYSYLFRSNFNVDELFYNCKFQGKLFQCSKLFKKVMTIQGICYVFNLQNYHQLFNEGISKNFDSYGKFEEYRDTQWSLDQGYFSNTTNQHPARASKLASSLELTMEINQKYYENGGRPMLLISKPNEVFAHFSYSSLYNFKTQTLVKLSAKSKRMDEELRKFSPENRGCYFEDERKLQFFKSYTKSNCMLECFTNYTLKSCGCVAYLLPHNYSTRICDSAKEAKCHNEEISDFPPANDSLNPCGCLPTCNDIEYSWTTIQNPLNYSPRNLYTLHLNFQFDSPEILEEVSHVAFGPFDFLTNFGGYLGLFIGGSFISILEVIYFFFVYLNEKLSKKKMQVASSVDQKDAEISTPNAGLSLAEIFDL